jgi:hypothetical protein
VRALESGFRGSAFSPGADLSAHGSSGEEEKGNGIVRSCVTARGGRECAASGDDEDVYLYDSEWRGGTEMRRVLLFRYEVEGSGKGDFEF